MNITTFYWKSFCGSLLKLVLSFLVVDRMWTDGEHGMWSFFCWFLGCIFSLCCQIRFIKQGAISVRTSATHDDGQKKIEQMNEKAIARCQVAAEVLNPNQH